MSSTATVNIRVTDINDEAPVFTKTIYDFRVKEGVIGAKVGKVEAVDPDANKNAEVVYEVPNDSSFLIDKEAGEIRTKTALDFETQSVHYLTVIARDRRGENDESSKSSSATVTVLVQDTSDEVPTFPKRLYEATVPENSENFLLTTVKAEDPDTEKSITYRIVAGDIDKFVVDTKTGEVRTKPRTGGSAGIDFERSQSHTLIIGTEEGRGNFLSSKRSGVRRSLEFSEDITVCTVHVTVTDVNDIAPKFILIPLSNTIRIGNDVKVGEKISVVRANDADGTSPNNEIRYSISSQQSSERASMYFGIDEKTGEIEVLDDLKRELYENYRLNIVATDLGEPMSLNTSVTLLIQV